MKLFCQTILLFFSLSVAAQQNDRQKITTELTKLSAAYKNAQYLSFDISYRYANEQQPILTLDSLNGSFKMSGDQYWYSLDNTESIGNREYMIVLFKEDHIMYLTRPSTASSAQNPISLIDSILLHTDSIRAKFTSSRSGKKISIEFPAGFKYKSVDYDINSSGYLSKMKSIMQVSELYDPTIRDLVDNTGMYAVVEASFANYKTTGNYTKQLDVRKYFKKEGDEFVALPPYENFKIFLGTTNL